MKLGKLFQSLLKHFKTIFALEKCIFFARDYYVGENNIYTPKIRNNMKSQQFLLLISLLPFFTCLYIAVHYFLYYDLSIVVHSIVVALKGEGKKLRKLIAIYVYRMITIAIAIVGRAISIERGKKKKNKIMSNNFTLSNRKKV